MALLASLAISAFVLCISRRVRSLLNANVISNESVVSLPKFSVMDIIVYPVKSCRGIHLFSSAIMPSGLQYDRQFMIVDQAGRFITQRDRPEMGGIETLIENGWLVLKFDYKAESSNVNASGNDTRCETVRVKLDLDHELHRDTQIVDVVIWNDTCKAFVVEEDNCNQKLTAFFNQSVRLVRLAAKRMIHNKYALSPEDNVQFADGFPVLINTTSSLNYLNTLLKKPVTFENFRPNIIVDTGDYSPEKPWLEDEWKIITLAACSFALVKPCTRCLITAIDPSTHRVAGVDPLATLQRKHGNKNGEGVFGMNGIPVNIRGVEIKIGDEVLVEK